MEGTVRVLSHMLGKARKGSADNTIQIIEKKPWDNADTEIKFVQQVTVFKLLHSSLYLFITDDYYNKNLWQYWLMLAVLKEQHTTN
jgi:hypothetical protein